MEKFIKDQIGNLGSVPPGMKRDREASWSKLEARLAQRKRRRGFVMLLAAASVVPLIIGGVILLRNVPSTDPSQERLEHLSEMIMQDDSAAFYAMNSGTVPDSTLYEIIDPALTDLNGPYKQEDFTTGDLLSNEDGVISYYGYDHTSAQKRGLTNQAPTPAVGASAGTYTVTVTDASAASSGPVVVFSGLTATGTSTATWNFNDGTGSNISSGQSVDLVFTSRRDGNLKGTEAYNYRWTGSDEILKRVEAGNVMLPEGYLSSGKLGGKGEDLYETERQQLDWNEPIPGFFQPENTDPTSGEGYSHFIENAPITASENAFSTFGLDVDVASYSNIRRFISTESQLPPTDAVRIEEMINYFDYNYRKPTGSMPIDMIVENGPCPWNDEAQLVSIGMQAKDVDKTKMPAGNMVFLVDVSGSMEESNKLPLVKSSMKKLVDELRPQDRVAIVVYAGAAGLVLPSTPGSDKAKIISALDNLSAGGSTAGGEGIELAYATALEHFVQDGNNRVILCTDGDFNVGPSSNEELEALITRMREKDVFLSVLGYGTGNYQDAMMEILADKGNGNYAYIDRQEEADRVFGKELTGTLNTIAKDVKLQVEFNPSLVKSYRLVGYENRMLNKEDFENDKIDAGDVGAGHTVTALYEVVLYKSGEQPSTAQAGEKLSHPGADNAPGVFCGELMRVNMRYKKPTGDVSSLMTWAIPLVPLKIEQTTNSFRWAAAVASFGMMLRHSAYLRDMDYATIIKLADSARLPDPDGERKEFIQIVKKAEALANKVTAGSH